MMASLGKHERKVLEVLTALRLTRDVRGGKCPAFRGLYAGTVHISTARRGDREQNIRTVTAE